MVPIVDLAALQELDRLISSAAAYAASMDAQHNNHIALIIYFLAMSRLELDDAFRETSRADSGAL